MRYVLLITFFLCFSLSLPPFFHCITLFEVILSSPSPSVLFFSSFRPEPQGRGGGSQQGQADSPLPEQDEEILGSDDDEQEDPNDYCRGKNFFFRSTFLHLITVIHFWLPRRKDLSWLMPAILSLHFHLTKTQISSSQSHPLPPPLCTDPPAIFFTFYLFYHFSKLHSE